VNLPRSRRSEDDLKENVVMMRVTSSVSKEQRLGVTGLKF